MRIHPVATLFVALLGTGCRNARDLQPLNTHYDDPIIIDNPAAFVAMIPDQDDHDIFLPKPLDSPISPKKSGTALLGHQAYEYIGLTGTDKDGVWKLTSTDIVVDFIDHKYDKAPAGSLAMHWVGSLVPTLGVVVVDSTDADGGKLRWVKGKGKIGSEKARGLVAKDGDNHDYRIAAVTYQTGGANDVAKRRADATTVTVKLCVKEDCSYRLQ